jgi:DNA-binding beta-propeller fold protein YncE
MKTKLLFAASFLLAACASDKVASEWPGSYLIVLEKEDGQAAVIEPNSGWVKDRYATDPGPHECAVSQNGQYAVTTNYGAKTPGNTLTVIALLERKRETVIDISPHKRPHGIVFLDRRTTVLVTSETSDAVLEVSLNSLKVERTIPTGAKGSHMIALSPDRKRAYTANVWGGSVSVLDLEKGTLEKVIPIGEKPEGIDVGPDGRIWVGVNDEAKVVVVDPRTLEVTHTIDTLPLPIRVKVTYDGKLAVVSCATSDEVVLIDTAKHEIVARIALNAGKPAPAAGGAEGPASGDANGPCAPVGIVIDPDSRLAFVAESAADRVAVIDLRERRVRGHFATGNHPDGLAWAFTRADPRGGTLDGTIR